MLPSGSRLDIDKSSEYGSSRLQHSTLKVKDNSDPLLVSNVNRDCTHRGSGSN